MNITLEELRRLSDSIGGYQDDRPGWLTAMPYALESTFHYYRVLWELVKQKKPGLIIEIGIDKAGSTLTLAEANPAGKVTSIDIDQSACENARKIAAAQGLKNLTVVCDDSLRQAQSFGERTIDLLFLDGAHDFEHCYGEYEAYRPAMKEGGLILFDDIHEGKQMETAWGYVADHKIELPRAHHSGFGACKVTHLISVAPLEVVREEAQAKFR